MPAKTRKEKQITELRRMLHKQARSGLSPSPNITSSPDKIITDESPINKKLYRYAISNQTNTQSSPTEISALSTGTFYIAADLKKTFTITGIVLFVELLLYWALEVRGIHL